MQKATLFRKKPNNAVRCTACQQYCTIPEGGTGICGVRLNQEGELYLVVYGKPCSINLDPVEKKPLFHFLPGTQIFSLGTFGCNFACSFCQNWDISQATREIKVQCENAEQQKSQILSLADSFEEWEPKKIVDYCTMHKIPSIAYTYNEPAIFFEYAYDTAKLAHKNGIKNVFVSNGYESEEALKKMKGIIDAMNIDLKAFTEGFYARNCRAKLQPVLETIKLANKLGIWVEVTTLIIPGENDSDAELKSIAEFIAGVDRNIPWHVTQFHPDFKMLERPATPIATLEKAYKIGKGTGLKFVYVGNAVTERENTYCPKCGKLLVKRIGYSIDAIGMENGRCGCGEKIPGIWK
ncbi:Radical SAM superfamily protein [uncultured archaeon]|nr:Radical SAM superfamily protein [uncultured archaeon]